MLSYAASKIPEQNLQVPRTHLGYQWWREQQIATPFVQSMNLWLMDIHGCGWWIFNGLYILMVAVDGYLMVDGCYWLFPPNFPKFTKVLYIVDSIRLLCCFHQKLVRQHLFAKKVGADMDSDSFLWCTLLRVMYITVSKVRLAPVIIAQSHLLSEATAGSRGITTGRTEPTLGSMDRPLARKGIWNSPSPQTNRWIWYMYTI